MKENLGKNFFIFIERGRLFLPLNLEDIKGEADKVKLF
jgi:hypothetical protein